MRPMEGSPAMTFRRLCLYVVASLVTVHALAEEPVAPDEGRRDRVIATVGNAQITVGEVEDGIAARSPFARKRLTQPEALRKFVDERVEAALLAQGAERAGYANDPEVARLVDEQMVQLFIRKEFEEKITADSVPQEQVEAYYKEHPEEFRQPEMRRAAHILVADEKQAKDLIAQAKGANTQKFSQLAKEHSLDDETKLRGGDLMYFTRDGKPTGGKDAPVNETLVDAAFALKKAGDVVKAPLDLGDGKWSVLRLTAVRPGQERTLKDATTAIRRRIWHQERKDALEKLLAELKAEVKPVSHPEKLDLIKLETTPPKPRTERPVRPPH